MKNSQLDYYIAGLIEGDGNIYIYIPKYYKYIKTMNNNRTYYDWDHINNMYF